MFLLKQRIGTMKSSPEAEAKHRREISDVLITMGLKLREAPSCSLLIKVFVCTDDLMSFEFDLSATSPARIIHKAVTEAYEKGRSDERLDTQETLRELMGLQS